MESRLSKPRAGGGQCKVEPTIAITRPKEEIFLLKGRIKLLSLIKK
jgi:hypothetical protein